MACLTSKADRVREDQAHERNRQPRVVFAPSAFRAWCINYRFHLGDIAQKGLTRPDMLVNQPRRNVRQPLRKRDVLVVRRRKDLEKDQIRVTKVFNIMGPGSFDVAHITLTKVHGASVSPCGKHGHAALSFHEVLPFILVLMPVEFAQAAGLYGYKWRGNIGRGEITPVDDFYTAAGGFFCRAPLARRGRAGIRNWPPSFADAFL